MFNRKKTKEPKIKKVRFKTFRDAYSVTKTVKPWVGAGIFGVFAITWSIGISIGIYFGNAIYLGFV